MEINGVNINSGVVWNGNAESVKAEKIDFSNARKPSNTDKFVLNLPTSETIYKRKEFVTDERMGEGCAFCYTYMERTLTFENGKYGTTTFSSRDSGGYFIINSDKTNLTFGKSGADMNSIRHAVEETRERRDRTLEQSTISGSLSGVITGNDRTVGGSVGFAAKNTVYKYSSVRETKGTVSYKNGGAGFYREKAMSSREIYNKCAVFLAEAFGEENSDLVLSDKDFKELFGKRDENEKTFSDISLQKLNDQLSRLREFMEKNLTAVWEKAPDCGSLKTFADTYLKLGTYKYSDIISIAEKMFNAENAK